MESESSKRLRKRHLLGIFLVLVVAFIWVSSSVLIQTIFQDADFDKPFFLTYLSTALFSIYLFGFAVKWKEWTSNTGLQYSSLKDEDTPVNVHNNSNDHITVNNVPIAPVRKMSVVEVIKLGVIFCPLWFFANYTYNLGLALTSVSSNTILSTLSGLFALVISIVLKVDTFNEMKLIAAILTLGGVVLVSVSDTSDGGRESALGDLLTIVGAMGYAMYCTLLKKKIVDETRLHMPMFFGFIGLLNIVMMWPFFFVLHYAGVEQFEFPSGKVFGYLLLNGLIGTVLSDTLEAWSILLTTPLINTLGLSMTIPFAMISDMIRKHTRFTIMYFFGSLLVISGFVLVNLSSASFEKKALEVKNNCVRVTRLFYKRLRAREEVEE